ncbi:MAG: choice-of-anchor L domain-containing protein [Bacteroidota bacterium]
MKTTTLVIIALFTTSISIGQVVSVDEEISNEDLINSFLIGTGVVISNIEQYGEPCQTGVAQTDSLSEFGFECAVGLSTGSLADLEGDITPILVDNPTIYNADMQTIANLVPQELGLDFTINDVFNVSGFSFDFVPIESTLSFDFTFGSEEYPFWINSPFNDTFAFLLSGPGIDGPYTNNSVNLATVPGSDLPITISSINSETNSEFYEDISDSNTHMNGRTTSINVLFEDLVVGETYHIAMLIGNGSDYALNSYVFLEKGSFSAVAPAEPGNIYDLNGDGYLDSQDLLMLMSDFGCEGSDCVGDFNDDQVTSFADFLDFLANF